jgi:hypothetical protein
MWVKRWWLTLALTGAIAYGSFYPFNFAGAMAPAHPWLALLQEPMLWTSFSDVLGNIVLFMPIGLCVRMIDPRLRPAPVVALTLAFVFYAYAIQVGQYYFPGRDPNISDAVWNATGCVAGVIVALLLRHISLRLPYGQQSSAHAIALTVLMFWLGSELAPFVPSLDVQHVKEALKPLLSLDNLVPARIFTLAFGIAVCAELLRTVFGEQHLRRNLGALLAIMMLGKLMIGSHAWHWATLFALPLGILLAWQTQKQKSDNRHLVLAGLLLAAFTLNELFPFELRGEAIAIRWIPFAARLEGNMLTNMDSMFLSLFQYTGILWLLTAQGARLSGLTIFLSLWVFAMEWIQTWLVDRTPDSTEVLLVIIAALLVDQMRPHGKKARKA